MQTNDTNSCADVRTNNQIITPNPKHRAAFARLEDIHMQMIELKSFVWMMDETSQRLSNLAKVADSISLLHRQVLTIASTIEGIHDDLDSLFWRTTPAKTEGGAA